VVFAGRPILLGRPDRRQLFHLLAQRPDLVDGGEISLDHGMGGGDKRNRRLLLAHEEIHGGDLRHQKSGRDRHR
jgi:hypothetical protein